MVVEALGVQVRDADSRMVKNNAVQVAPGVSRGNLRKGAALNAVQIAEVLGREVLKKG